MLFIESYYEGLFRGDQLEKVYLDSFRWLNEEHIFLIDGKPQIATIRGISETGKLKVEVRNEIRHFDLKEIIFLE